MNMVQRVATQPETALLTTTALSPVMTEKRDSSWQSALLGFDAIGLSEMDHVALLRRADTKYIFSEEQLSQALAHLTDHYQILEINGLRIHRYRTLYFDTQDMELYRQHHNGWRNRYKVRERTYVDSGMTFLEIKHKVNADTTIKSRVRTQGLSTQITQDAAPFLGAYYPYQGEALEAKLLNTFQRITLVSMRSAERLTVDVGVCFLWNDVHVSLAGMAIAEVKQDGFSTDSEFVRQMRALGVRPTSFSKYCIGVSILYPEVKHNNFKPQLRQIDQLVQERRTV